MLRFHNFYPLILLVFTIGCSENVGLKGTVTFSDDGSPLTVGTVAFLKDGEIARAPLDEKGNYVVGFERAANGLPPGRWQVYITGAEEVVNRDEETGTVTRAPLIEAKYQNPETSELVLEVNASTRDFSFSVDRVSKP